MKWKPGGDRKRQKRKRSWRQNWSLEIFLHTESYPPCFGASKKGSCMLLWLISHFFSLECSGEFFFSIFYIIIFLPYFLHPEHCENFHSYHDVPLPRTPYSKQYTALWPTQRGDRVPLYRGNFEIATILHNRCSIEHIYHNYDREDHLKRKRDEEHDIKDIIPMEIFLLSIEYRKKRSIFRIS